jgi:hypothetical protein
MNWTRIIAYLVSIAAGIGLLLLLPRIDSKIAEVEVLLADADEVLAARQSSPLSTPGHPDEVETEIQRHRMSYLAVIKDKRFKRKTVLVCGPLLIAFGVIALGRLGWSASFGGPRRKKPARRKRPKRRRKSPAKGKRPAGRPRG